MKKMFSLVAVLVALMLAACGGSKSSNSSNDDEVEGIAINEENFPDEGLCNALKDYDWGMDEVITDDELEQITILHLIDEDIRSVKGIEVFTHLKELVLNDNNIKELDVTSIPSLHKLYIIDSHLEDLNVSGMQNLDTLVVMENQLTNLSLKGCTGLLYLDCCNNQISTLDIEDCVNMISLDARGNQLGTLRLSASQRWSKILLQDNQLTAETAEEIAAALPEYQVLDINDAPRIWGIDELISEQTKEELLRKNWTY